MDGSLRYVKNRNEFEMINQQKSGQMPAPNGRFGVMAAVVPQKRQCKFGSLYPAGSLVEAATTPSRWDVVGKPRECGANINGE